ncbi:MAG: diacylglycerol kinase family protein [Bacteroidetes bacterium]|nr:diacylglycerol kinase family protein [Bacteroidota bacterium]
MKRFYKSAKFAFNGLKYMILTQRNFKIQLVCAIITISLGYFFEVNTIEWALLSICISIVLGFEILNTSIEYLCDIVNPQTNMKIKVIKDLAAAAVLIVGFTSLVVGLIIFLPKLFVFFKI